MLPFAELGDDGSRYDSAAMLHRDGRLAGIYGKVHVPHPVEHEPGRSNPAARVLNSV